MTIVLKAAARSPEAEAAGVRARVADMLARFRTVGAEAVRRAALDLDGWSGPIEVDEAAFAAADRAVPERVKADIRFAHDNIRRFAEAQRGALVDFALEVIPGLTAGQRHIPVSVAGAYVPGGRYSHVASALMTVATARAAGVGTVVTATPPRPGIGIPPAVLWTLRLAGADRVLALGGVQAIAALAFGHFAPPVDVLAGPGNAYVAEAKRLLAGEVGIDMIAGPTDILVVADGTADPDLVAVDLVAQAEHGATSPVWLATTDRPLAEAVIARVPALIAALPEPAREAAEAAWRDFGEVVLCADRDEMAAVADRYAPEHLHVQAADLDWWLGRLTAYGSLFLGEETTVAFGDKAAGPNHVLPTLRAARYTGGLSVARFMKAVTWQRATRAAVRDLGAATARISRVEGMEAHARSADIRLARFFPGERFDLGRDGPT